MEFVRNAGSRLCVSGRGGSIKSLSRSSAQTPTGSATPSCERRDSSVNYGNCNVSWGLWQVQREYEEFEGEDKRRAGEVIYSERLRYRQHCVNVGYKSLNSTYLQAVQLSP